MGKRDKHGGDAAPLKPHKSISFDRVAHLYDETRSLPGDQMRAIVNAFHRELAEYGTVLEVGVGTGRFALPLQERGVHLLGVDISPQMMARGLDKGLRDILLADAITLPFRDNSVDATYSIHVLHLVGDWRVALKEISRVTRSAYYTIASYWEEDRNPWSVYWETLGEHGVARELPGVFERRLPDHIPPTDRFVIGSFVERREADTAVRILEKRGYSGQWSLPEDLHEVAVKAVKAEFKDRLLTLKKRVELIRWDVDDLIRD